MFSDFRSFCRDDNQRLTNFSKEVICGFGQDGLMDLTHFERSAFDL